MQEISPDLIKEAALGNVLAFEEVYKRTSGFVYSVALRMLGSPEDAQDVTQEVFITVSRKLGGYRFESSLKTWLYRITVNLSINHLRRHRKQRQRTIPYEETMDQPQRNEALKETSATLLESEQEERLQEMLDILNPDQKACLILRSIEGLSYRQIAESLKININTVRTRLKRARERLMAWRNEKRGGKNGL